jgi:hypothetical protein
VLHTQTSSAFSTFYVKMYYSEVCCIFCFYKMTTNFSYFKFGGTDLILYAGKYGTYDALCYLLQASVLY